MIRSVRWFVLVGAAALACMFALGSSAIADEASDGRVLCTKCSEAVVKLEVVSKETMSYEGNSRTREEKTEVVGTVIDPSGLIVASLSCVDPSSSYEEDIEEGFSISSQITGVKIITSSGKQIPAKLVLRDKDLDLAFIRPTEKLDVPMTFIDLKDASKPDILDQVIIITRLGTVANRTISACIERVQAIIEKPRKCYTVSMSSMGSEYGAPVLSMDGKTIGIVLYRETAGGSDYDDDNWIPIVMPAEEILPIVAQVPQN